MVRQARRRNAESATLIMNVHEFDWSKVSNVVYDRNGVVIRSIPAIQLEGSVSFILEWNGLKLAFSGDTLANKWWVEHAQGADQLASVNSPVRTRHRVR